MRFRINSPRPASSAGDSKIGRPGLLVALFLLLSSCGGNNAEWPELAAQSRSDKIALFASRGEYLQVFPFGQAPRFFRGRFQTSEPIIPADGSAIVWNVDDVAFRQRLVREDLRAGRFSVIPVPLPHFGLIAVTSAGRMVIEYSPGDVKGACQSSWADAGKDELNPLGACETMSNVQLNRSGSEVLFEQQNRVVSLNLLTPSAGTMASAPPLRVPRMAGTWYTGSKMVRIL